MVYQLADNEFRLTSPAKFIDFHPPTEFTKPIIPPEVVESDAAIEWRFQNIKMHQLTDTENHVKKDTSHRKGYLETSFTQVIMDLQSEIQDLQTKVLLGGSKVSEKLGKKLECVNELIQKKQLRL